MTRLLRVMCLLMLPAMGWAQAAAPTQDAQPDQGPVTTLKVETRLVAISAVVKNKAGEPIGGMTKDDFVLKQDGKEQPIRYFSKGSDNPLTLALMVDTSASQRTLLGDESLASDVFFETMLGRKEDRAMLVQFDTRVIVRRGLTSSADALHLALASLGSRAATVGGTLLNDAVYTVAKDVLAAEKGRKAMVILSDGGDNGSRRSLAEAIEQAQRGDVQIYSILYSASEGPGGIGTGRPARVDPGVHILQELSNNTGGRVFEVSPGLSLREIFAEIGQDLRFEYELGYTPPAGTQPNSYHKLELKARDRKFSVQARKGFFAPP